MTDNPPNGNGLDTNKSVETKKHRNSIFSKFFKKRIKLNSSNSEKEEPTISKFNGDNTQEKNHEILNSLQPQSRRNSKIIENQYKSKSPQSYTKSISATKPHKKTKYINNLS